MINPTETLRITITRHAPQLASNHFKHCNYNFFATTRSCKSIYLSKYTGKGYIYVANPFKVVVL